MPQRSTTKRKKPTICSECHDEAGVYTFCDGKMYCKPCSSAVRCDACGLELYTVISSNGDSLKSRFKSDAAISPQCQQSFQEMNSFTTLHGHASSALSLKPVTNFFQRVKQYPWKSKSKSLNLCMGCLREHAKKTTLSILKKPKNASTPKSKMLANGIHLGKKSSDTTTADKSNANLYLKDLSLFEHILSFLSMPQDLVNLMLVHKTWRLFFTHHTNFSWVTGLCFAENQFHSQHPLYSTMEKRTRELQQDQAENQRSSRSTNSNHNGSNSNEANCTSEWTDRRILLLMKNLRKQCRQFIGFPSLKSITFGRNDDSENDATPVQFSDFTFLCLSECIKRTSQLEQNSIITTAPPSLAHIELSSCQEITWITMLTLLNLTENLNSLTIYGSEQLYVLRKLMQSSEYASKFESLSSIGITQVDKLGLSILQQLANYKNMHTLSLTSSTVYWDEKGSCSWKEMKPLSHVTTLDLTDSEMSMRDSLVDLLQFFPNVEHLHCYHVQRSNIADKVEMFQRCGAEFTEDICQSLEFRMAQDKETIIQAGEIGHEMFFLTKGEVEILNSDGHILVTLKEGVFFGEIALLFDTPRTATVRAVGRCHLYVLDQASLFRVMRIHPQSKDIIKQEARRRWDQLQEQQKGKSASTPSDSPKEKTPPPAQEDASDNASNSSGPPPSATQPLIDTIRSMYQTSLKTLHLKAKGITINLSAFLSNMLMLQTLSLQIETIKKFPPIHLQLPKDEGAVESLTALHLDFTDSQYQISAEGWKALSISAPHLEHFSLCDAVNNHSLNSITESCPRLKTLHLADSFGASKSVLRALGHLSLTELTSDCSANADSVIKAINRNRPPLRLLDLQNVVFNENQMHRLLSQGKHLERVCVQTSTMSGINLGSFRMKYPQYAHIAIEVNHNVIKRKRNPLSRSSSLSSMLSRTSSRVNLQMAARVKGAGSSPKNRKKKQIVEKQGSFSVVTTDADMKKVQEKLQKIAKRQNSGRSSVRSTVSGVSSQHNSRHSTPKKVRMKQESSPVQQDTNGRRSTNSLFSDRPQDEPVQQKPPKKELPPRKKKFSPPSVLPESHSEEELRSNGDAQKISPTAVDLPAPQRSISPQKLPPLTEKGRITSIEEVQLAPPSEKNSGSSRADDISPDIPQQKEEHLSDEQEQEQVVKNNKKLKKKKRRKRSSKRRAKSTFARSSKVNMLDRTFPPLFGGEKNGPSTTISPYTASLAPVVQRSAPLSSLKAGTRRHFVDDLLPSLEDDKLAPVRVSLRHNCNSRSLRLGEHKKMSPYGMM